MQSSLDVDFFRVRVGVADLVHVFGPIITLCGNRRPYIRGNEVRGYTCLAYSSIFLFADETLDREELVRRICGEHLFAIPANNNYSLKVGSSVPFGTEALMRCLNALGVQFVYAVSYGSKLPFCDFQRNISPYCDNTYEDAAFDFACTFSTPNMIVLCNTMRQATRGSRHPSVQKRTKTTFCGLSRRCGFMELTFDQHTAPAAGQLRLRSLSVYST